MPEPDRTPDEQPRTAEELGRSYAALLGGGAWQVDGDPERLAAEPAAATEAPPPPAEEPAVRDAEEPPAPEEELPPSPEQVVEALLFVGGTPLTAGRACEIVRGLTPGQFQEIVDGLNRRYRRQNRPYAVQAADQGFVLSVRSRYRPLAGKLFGSPREARLSPAAVDVVALIAYRQPVAKSEIDALRGADCGPAVRQLVRLGLIAVAQRGGAGQREVSYGTTPRFLEVFGLRSLDDLPRLGEVQRV